MKTLMCNVPLYNLHTGCSEIANVFRGADSLNLAQIEGIWRPAYAIARQEIEAGHRVHVGFDAEGEDWVWTHKLLEARRQASEFEVVVLECCGITQAIMYLNKSGDDYVSLHPEHAGAPIVYTEGLVSSPINRKAVVAFPVYKGAGSALIAAAITISSQMGKMGGSDCTHCPTPWGSIASAWEWTTWARTAETVCTILKCQLHGLKKFVPLRKCDKSSSSSLSSPCAATGRTVVGGQTAVALMMGLNSPSYLGGKVSTNLGAIQSWLTIFLTLGWI